MVDMDGVRIDKVLVQPLKLDQQAQAEATLALRAVLPPAQPAPQARNNQLRQQDDKRE